MKKNYGGAFSFSIEIPRSDLKIRHARFEVERKKTNLPLGGASDFARTFF